MKSISATKNPAHKQSAPVLNLDALNFPSKHLLTGFFLLVLSLISLSQLAQAEVQPWPSMGPYGGDARSFAAHPSTPKKIYLGTTNSSLYLSEDGGNGWKRIAKLGKSDDLILDNILVDSAHPEVVLVGAWVVGSEDGGLFRSKDGGKTFTEISDLKGQSIRSLAQAPSAPNVIIAGTLRGVYRSRDEGRTWSLISPKESLEIHEVESIAIDPEDPEIIYAGTWHLPWKTTDGGVSWHNIKQGVIDDSDVFSIIIDPKQRATVYASACSGIYKSQTSGELFAKIQGIPSTARRTRVLMQDPTNHSTVYAGTTEGLYRTTDAGTKWQRMTGPDTIVNDVYVDPTDANHVLLATDRSGVLKSSDGAFSFIASNEGFSQRQVSSVIADSRDAGTLYSGVLNDKGYGGVFVSHDSGSTWQQQSEGLNGLDVYQLSQNSDGTLLAGTNHGIYRWADKKWSSTNSIVKITEKKVEVKHKNKKVVVTKQSVDTSGSIQGRVSDVMNDGDSWYTATSQGLFVSSNQGLTWQGGPINAMQDFIRVAARGQLVLAASVHSLFISPNKAHTWTELSLPSGLHSIRSVAITPDDKFWVGGIGGVWTTSDNGATWHKLDRLPVTDINSISWDPGFKRVFITGAHSSWIFGVDPTDLSWKWWDAGWNLHGVSTVKGRLVAASLFHGVLLEPADGATAVSVPAATQTRASTSPTQ